MKAALINLRGSHMKKNNERPWGEGLVGKRKGFSGSGKEMAEYNGELGSERNTLYMYETAK